jgi:hypothetical protein
MPMKRMSSVREAVSFLEAELLYSLKSSIGERDRDLLEPGVPPT